LGNKALTVGQLQRITFLHAQDLHHMSHGIFLQLRRRASKTEIGSIKKRKIHRLDLKWIVLIVTERKVIHLAAFLDIKLGAFRI
jgi:hypothetical protein